MLGVEKSPADAPLEDDRQALLATVLDIDEEALRGLSLSTVLANRARLFAEEGKAAREDPTGTFALSRPVQYLSHFMSHSWRTGRLVKYAALCVHFNLRRAAIALRDGTLVRDTECLCQLSGLHVRHLQHEHILLEV